MRNEVSEIRESRERGEPEIEFEVPKNTMKFPAFEDSRDDRFEIDVPARLLDALGAEELEYDKGMTMQFRNIPGSEIWKLRLFSR